jgi:hypothetical protein
MKATRGPPATAQATTLTATHPHGWQQICLR